MNENTSFLLLNQMAGPLFRELAEDLADIMPGGCKLVTGHPDTLNMRYLKGKLIIHRAPMYNRSSKISRLYSWFKYSVVALLKMLLADKNTIMLIVSNPPFLGPLALLVHWIRKVPYIVLVYDLHPDTLICFGVLNEHSFVARAWRFVNKIVWERSDGVYTLGSVMAAKLASQFSPEKTRLGHVGIVPPWADTDIIKPIDKANNHLATELCQNNVLTVLYSGNMGISHDIDSILGAAKILSKRNDIRFLFIGEGAKWQSAKNFIDTHHLCNALVLPFQPEENLPFTMALGDVSLVALDKGAEGLMVPSKMYYYMAAGSAVIGICQGKSDLSETIKRSQCGMVVEPGKPKELAKLIVSLADSKNKLDFLKKNSRNASLEYYSRKVCMDDFLVSLRSSGIIN